MNFKSLLFVAALICAFQASASLNFCGCQQDRGVDVCGCKKTIAPRPYPVQVPRLNFPVVKTICKEAPAPPKPFNPIGDACSCGQRIVKPAPLPNNRLNCIHRSLPQISLPKPQCNCGRSNDKQQEDSDGYGNAVRAPEQYQSYSQDGATIYFQTAKSPAPSQPKPEQIPADVVSIAIAKRMQKNARNGISEKQLQYGSMKVPTVQQKPEQKGKNIQEELFYDTKGNVLEIQPYIFKQTHESTEESDSEESTPKPKPQPFQSAYLDFEQLGYKPYAPSKSRYTVVKNSEQLKLSCNNQQPRHHHQHRRGESCDCYKDLVVDQSSISDQSISFESNDQHFNTRVRT